MDSKKISLTLPSNIIKIISKNGKRSEFITKAIRSYINTHQTEFPRLTKLQAEMIAGYISRAKDDLKLAKEMEGALADGLNDTEDKFYLKKSKEPHL